MGALQKLIDEANDLAARMKKRAADLSPVEMEWEIRDRAETAQRELRTRTYATDGTEFQLCILVPYDIDLRNEKELRPFVEQAEYQFRKKAAEEGKELRPPKNKMNSYGMNTAGRGALPLSPFSDRDGLSGMSPPADAMRVLQKYLEKNSGKAMDQAVLDAFFTAAAGER